MRRLRPQARALSAVLREDLLDPPGLTPLFGQAERDAMVLERLLAERRLAADALLNLEALCDCLREAMAEHDAGKRSGSALIAEMRTVLGVIEAQLRYDEAAALNGAPLHAG